jgi:hypothetical protein
MHRETSRAVALLVETYRTDGVGGELREGEITTEASEQQLRRVRAWVFNGEAGK